MIKEYVDKETRKVNENYLQLHPLWKGGALGGWGDSKCDYCDYAADMIYKGGHTRFEHQNRLLEDKKQASSPVLYR